MSRLKSMPRFAWLVIGVCVTALVLPSAAYASGALTFVGIKGTSTNKADVTAAIATSDNRGRAEYVPGLLGH